MNFELSGHPDNLLLAKLVTLIIEHFDGELLNKAADFDSVYIDFRIATYFVTLHQQTFVGIILFPTNLENSTQEEILFTEKIADFLLINI